jgi:hypothetical protein
MNGRTILIHGHEVPVEKIAEAEQMVLAWTDEQEADGDEPCVCFFSECRRIYGWRAVEGGDAATLAEADFSIGLADALEAWRRVENWQFD